MRCIFLVVALNLVLSCTGYAGEAYDAGYNPASRIENEYRLYQTGMKKGSWELWIPRAELPEEMMWKDLDQQPPVTLTEAVRLAAEMGEHSNEELHTVFLLKEYPRTLAPSRFWKYVVSFGDFRSSVMYVVLMDGRIWKVDEWHPWKQGDSE